LEYYRKEFPEIKANASQIPWDLDDGYGELLPVMQSDITLSSGNRVLIIDAKYYSRMTQVQYDTNTLHSNNLYQIYTYVKNMDAGFKDTSHEVSGMLLYAKTDEDFQFQEKIYHMSGNQITVKSLDLNCSFDEITEQLNSIIAEFF
jgi:5-methylcytosine-specific restriction enzyme subunit McrC